MPLRTTTMAASLVLGLASTASAEWESREELVHETTTSVEIELTPETVICSHADYSANFLKVLIPELAAITLLDHQNTDAGAPCVAAGECAPFGDHAPGDILDETDTTETVDITVRATRLDSIDHDAQTCATTLQENVDLVIRGVPFTHQRWADLGGRPYADCISSPAPDDEAGTPAGDEGKSDTYGTPDGDEPTDDVADESAGCAAGGAGGTGAGLALVLLGLAFAAPRRKRR